VSQQGVGAVTAATDLSQPSGHTQGTNGFLGHGKVPGAKSENANGAAAEALILMGDWCALVN